MKCDSLECFLSHMILVVLNWSDFFIWAFLRRSSGGRYHVLWVTDLILVIYCAFNLIFN